MEMGKKAGWEFTLSLLQLPAPPIPSKLSSKAKTPHGPASYSQPWALPNCLIPKSSPIVQCCSGRVGTGPCRGQREGAAHGLPQPG